MAARLRQRKGKRDPLDPNFGSIYGGADPSYITDAGVPVWMWRKRQAVRFYDAEGKQHGPEQSNVAPAMAYARYKGWRRYDDVKRSRLHRWI
jgi:hypothetical protein